MTRQTAAPLKHESLSATHRSVQDLVHQINDGHWILNPPYQRGSVWTEDQRIALMRSWLTGIPVPAIIINDRGTSAWRVANGMKPTDHSNLVYACVDGKQRLETAVAWFDGTLAIPASWIPTEWIEHPDALDLDHTEEDGAYVRSTGLTVVGRRIIASNMLIPVAEARVTTIQAEAEIYLLVNGQGTPQTDADMANAARIAEGK